MTTGTNPDVRAGALRWAAELLGVQENASSAEARRAYFRKLRENDFLPPRSLYHALRVFEGKWAQIAPDEEWLYDEKGLLRAEVASFAEEFFTLPVTQRRKRWNALFCKCQRLSPLLGWLQALRAGLRVENPSLTLDQTFRGQLAEHLLQSFPLSPLAQAASRQAFLRKIEEPAASVHRRSWEKAARYLLAEWPALAALDQELVQHIAKLRRRLKRQSKMHERSQRNRQAAFAGSEKRNLWWRLLIAFGVVSGIVRGFLSSNNSSSWKSTSPSYSAPYGNRKAKDAAPFNLPPIHELLDPSKFDVEIVNPEGVWFLRFTPRPGSAIIGSNGQQVNNGQPVWLGEATLRLLGVTQEQMKDLSSRAAKRKLRDSTPNTPPEKIGPTPPKGSQGDKARP